MTFKELSIGEKFEFDHSALVSANSLMLGPWIKIAPRRYQHWALGLIYTVGSVKAQVISVK